MLFAFKNFTSFSSPLRVTETFSQQTLSMAAAVPGHTVRLMCTDNSGNFSWTGEFTTRNDRKLFSNEILINVTDKIKILLIKFITAYQGVSIFFEILVAV